MPSQGDIVLIPIPFTDLSSTRRRPVIVISNNGYHARTEDMVVVAMTSNPNVTPYSFVLTNADLLTGSLDPAGNGEPDKIYTLSQQLVMKKFGQVREPVLDEIARRFGDVTRR